jgi:hypothetical protein
MQAQSSSPCRVWKLPFDSCRGRNLTICGAVFGEPTMAMAGKLVTVPAGPKESVAKILPYIEGV